ncbi:IclR family transcriptional regulator [Yersinia frederiksenii]|nr:IclR family transcriptional regulator [Yersinia frederiksenii]
MALPISIKRGKKPKTAAQTTPAATGQVQSLTRGLKLLEYISEAQGSVALTDLAQQAGLPNSTTHRLLTTMQQQGFVRQVGDLGLWTMGLTPLLSAVAFCKAVICSPWYTRCYGV